MNLTGRAPVQKPPHDLRVKDPDYLDEVRALPCCGCGRYGPSEPHHCRDSPAHYERTLYDRVPGAAMTSADHDAIPLCQPCHWLFHNKRSEFHRKYGQDYKLIAPTRAKLQSED